MKENANIRIADEVVRTVAAKAVMDVAGVHRLSGGVADEFSRLLGRKRPTNGVKVNVGENDCTIDVFVIIEYGYNIEEVCNNIHEKIMEEITKITGLLVSDINIYVQDVHIEDKEDQDKN
ncbi:MAG: Asp23/Gls24 family envelope stress response protein [Fusobacteriaceae bacterium]